MVARAWEISQVYEVVQGESVCSAIRTRLTQELRLKVWVCYWYTLYTAVVHCYIFPFALPHADTSDCLLPFLPHPFTRLLYFYDLILLTRSHLVASCPVRYSSGAAIRSAMYDTHLRATHTTTGSIGGVQIPIYLVSDATDSLQQSVAVLKLYQ